LRAVESVSISSATETTAEPIVRERPAEPIAAAFNEADSFVAVASAQETAPTPAPEIATTAPTSRPRVALRPRRRRHALLAASVFCRSPLQGNHQPEGESRGREQISA
jgi:hypothetical protein